jgi:hypothetical protein
MLMDTIFSVTFALVLVIALFLLTYSGIYLRKFSVLSLFIIFYILFDYIGILPLYFQWYLYPVNLGVINKTIIFKMLIFSSCAFILIIFGFIYMHKVIGLNTNMVKHQVLEANTMQRIFVFCLFLLCVLVLLAYLYKVDTIALFQALKGDLSGAALSRSNMGNAFVGKYWRYKMFFRFILDYCVIFSFADYLINRRRISIIIFCMMFFTAVFSATMAIEKGPFAILLIMLYLTYIIFKGGNYWQKAAKYFVIMLICTLSLLYIYFMGAPDVFKAFK